MIGSPPSIATFDGRPERSLRLHFGQPDLRDHVRRHGLLGKAGNMMEIAQPAGAYGSPATAELTLVQPQVPGIDLRKTWGMGRFDGVAPLHSLWLIPPWTSTDLTVRGRHVIRTMSITTDHLRDALPDRDATPDFGHLACAPFHNPVVHHLMQALWHAASHDDPPARLHSDGVILALVAELLRLSGEKPQPPRGGLAPWQLRVVTEAIAASPAADLSLATLAGLARLSPFHFARAFQASLGVPPYRYQKRLRVERATALLADGRLSVLEVGLAVGYESGQAFARAFRQEMGVNPRDWRRQRLS